MSIVQRNWLTLDDQWLSGFRYRLPFYNIPHSNYRVADGGSAVTDIPLAIFISNGANGSGERSQIDFASTIFNEVANDWKKIAVTTADGVTQCEVEVVKWDRTAERGQLYFLCPSIGSELNGHRLSNKFYLYFDGQASDNDTYVGDYTDTTLMQTIWADYHTVLHCEQTPTENSSGDIKDSSGNGHDYTWRRDDSDPLSEFTKQRLGDGASQAYNLDTTNDNLITGGGSGGFATDFLGNTGMGVMLLAQFSSTSADFVLDFSSDSNAERKFRIQINGTDPYYYLWQCWDNTDTVILSIQSTVSLTAGTQRVIHTYYNGGSALGDGAIWVDLTKVEGTPTGSTINNNDTDTNPIAWGGRSDWNTANAWDGLLGEMRLTEDGDLLDDISYVAINYHSVLNILWVFQEVEEKPTVEYQYRLPIFVKPTNIDADLTEYTLRIFLGTSVGDDDQDVSAVFDEIGGGLLFRKMRLTDQDGTTILPLEVQYWDDQGEFAVLNTKVPTIDSADGRHLFLYYDSEMPFAGETLSTEHKGSSAVAGDWLRFIYHPFKIKPNFPDANPLSCQYLAFQKSEGSEVSDSGDFTNIDDDDFDVDTTYGPYIAVGDGEYINFGEDGWMETAYDGEFSVEVVARFPVELSHQQYLFTKRKGDGDFQGWEMHFDPGSDVVRFNMDFGASACVIRTTTTNVDDNTVRQFVMTYDGSDTIGGFLMFMNGASDRTVDVDNFPLGSGTLATTISMRVGARETLQAATTNFHIFEARLYNRQQIPTALIKANYYSLTDEILRFDSVEERSTFDDLEPEEMIFVPSTIEHVGFPTIFVDHTAEQIELVPGTHQAITQAQLALVGKAWGTKPKILDSVAALPHIADEAG